MKVILAGMNIDVERLHELRTVIQDVSEHNSAHFERLKGILSADCFTPETLSAAYARISRSPLSVEKLRKKAAEDVQKSRKSNESIVFDMGHSSVAEHAVFNIDIIGITRLAAEFIQQHRLASFTEKSQRYVKLDEDYLIPSELEGDSGLRERFIETVKELNRTYNELYTRIAKYLTGKHPELTDADISGMAKEDARYVLPLATTSQMGMTVNARSAEYIIKKLSAAPLTEVQMLSKKLHEILQPATPSLIRYTTPSDYDCRQWQTSYDIGESVNTSITPVQVIDYSVHGEKNVIAALLYRNGTHSFEELSHFVEQHDITKLLDDEWRGINFYDSVDRAFELADVTFELTVSASCYAQLKRHRMASIISGMYSSELTPVIPETVKDSGCEKIYLAAIDQASELSREIAFFDGPASIYALTNAHRRRVIMKANVREWYHFARLRSDAHAQWEIRHLSHMIESELRGIYPALTALMMGKDEFIQKNYHKSAKKGPRS